jgi:hypothetical protein
MNAADIMFVHEPDKNDWALFNGVEVAPVEATPDGTVEVIEEHQIGSDSSASYFWCVYMHLDSSLSENGEFGGLVCVADIKTKESAHDYAANLEQRLRDVIGDRLVPMHTEAT